MTLAASSLKIDHAETSALSGTYRLLARLWLREADQVLLIALREPPMCDLFEQAGGLPPQAEVDDLAVDFCQLFVGPSGHLPPYQSVWQGGQFQSQAIHSMRDFADLVEYDFASPPHATMPDHFGLQLDVMGSILERVSDDLASLCTINRGQAAASNRDQAAASNRDQAAASDHFVVAAEVAKTFFKRHLIWSELLLSSAAPRARTNFYRSVISLTREFLETEQQSWLS